MPAPERVPYRSIADRPGLPPPDGARVLVFCVVNVEEWLFDAPIPRPAVPPPAGGPGPVPDVPNWAWHEYGMRVGFWRLLQCLRRHAGAGVTVALNAHVCRTYPSIVQAAVDAGWEVMGHGVVQRPMTREPDEAAAIREAVALIREATGRAPRGWLGPGLAETPDTPERLVDAGIEYCCDWLLDDQPTDIRVRTGRLVSIPYTVELNDVPLFVLQHHAPDEFVRRVRDTVEVLHAEGEKSPRVMAIGLHPYLMGVPHRIGYLDRALAHVAAHPGVVFWRGGQILDWYLARAR
ncbi:MAG: polysaccharide deacetylase family protein [Candidatus Rokuibacteriota bacterium]